jgi:hypothetical protein
MTTDNFYTISLVSFLQYSKVSDVRIFKKFGVAIRGSYVLRNLEYQNSLYHLKLS